MEILGAGFQSKYLCIEKLTKNWWDSKNEMSRKMDFGKVHLDSLTIIS